MIILEMVMLEFYWASQTLSGLQQVITSSFILMTKLNTYGQALTYEKAPQYPTSRHLREFAIGLNALCIYPLLERPYSKVKWIHDYNRPIHFLTFMRLLVPCFNHVLILEQRGFYSTPGTMSCPSFMNAKILKTQIHQFTRFRSDEMHDDRSKLLSFFSTCIYFS